MREKIPLIYIAGSGRSGTTLIERYLSESFGFCGCGELRYFWKRLCLDGDLCSCKKPIESCDFWSGFFEKIGSSKEVYSKKVISIQNQIDFNKYLIVGFDDDLVKDYLSLIEPLYEYAFNKSGKIIIDSSKHPSYLAILSRSDKLSISCLHVIRNPLAVAFSWSKKVVRPEVAISQQFMPTFSPLRVSFQWSLYNVWFRLSKTKYFSYSMLSYDEFCENPNESVITTLKSLNLHNFESEKRVYFHSVAGNPMRFKEFKGIRSDSEWKKKINPWVRAVVSSITFPARVFLRILE